MAEIEKGIPIPRTIDESREKYPFKRMDIGDSFAIVLPEDEVDRTAKINTVRASIRYYAKKHDIHCTSRIVAENGVEVIRVWRTS